MEILAKSSLNYYQIPILPVLLSMVSQGSISQIARIASFCIAGWLEFFHFGNPIGFLLKIVVS